METQEALREKPRILTELAFRRLLEWLDDGVDTHGKAYMEMRQRLVSYFDRRNRPSPDELADDTLNRVARSLEKTGETAITPPARYCYVVARFVLLEDIRDRHRHAPFDERRSGATVRMHGAVTCELEDGLAAQEKHFQCLDRCLDTLKPAQRELIIEYYRDAGRQKIERRRDLALRLGISMNALAIRAGRIRDALGACVAARVGNNGSHGIASPSRNELTIQVRHVAVE
jgi:DNA-directed RNA polymerase specialized sigma24 family protein